ncbi:RNA polymerase sigma-70 factor [Ancylomarina salipaludis]|uniref:RNA polymerase sigma-70 factor n=1 Tax=Ancylomarina salipaludis TaxID=2501299 RepID=A0A4V1MZR5_9BACT|nr:RNA polymerase sigma-70 factor [Ancylomarina salipaludis]RXQ88052.1 RNA polymerase sigma-70 factor [Ancylomarina salipaludis]
MENDRLMIMQLREGNRLVFKKMFDQYYRPLRGFAKKYIDEDATSDDLVQEAFLGLWRSREQISDFSAIKSYLYTAVRNNCLNHLRHEKVKSKNQSEILSLSTDEYFDDAVIEEEVYAEVYEAIKELSPQSRRIVVMSMNGLSNPEIAAELEVSVNTVKTLKKRAYQFLRERLKGAHWVLFLLLN